MEQRRGAVVIGVLAMVALLGACGGGGGGGGGAVAGVSATPTPLVSTTPTPTRTATPTQAPTPTLLPIATSAPTLVPNVLAPDCAGANCSASNANTYSGSGVGVWSYANTTTTSATVSVSIAGLNNNTVTAVFTNLGASAVPLPAPSLSQASLLSSANVDASAQSAVLNQIPEHIRKFNENPPLQDIAPVSAANRSIALRPQLSVVGDTRTMHDMNDAIRNVTLRKQVTTSDGRVLNVWVEDSEFAAGKITSTHVDTLAAKFATGPDAIYTMVTSLIGKPWGVHSYSNMIVDNNEINIFWHNINNNGGRGGTIGFFSSVNNFLTSAQPTSDQAIAFYLDTEFYYGAGAYGQNFEHGTLAHEFTHMIHFYQRNVLKGNSYRFATWLNELAAEGMTDIVGSRLGGYTDSRYPGWLSKPGFNCDITNWDSNLSSTCFSYNIVGSYGGFLLRHYGLNYYKALFNNSVTNANSSMDILAHAISAAGGDRLQTFRHWGASIAMLPATGSPDGFGYPARSEGGFSLPAYNGATFLSRRTLPSAPANLVPYGHHPVVKSGVSGTYTNTITVPANTHLSVVIQ